MGRKIYFLAILIIFLSLNFLYAAEDSFVDVTKANQDIQALKTENTKLLADNDVMDKDNLDKENKINEWKKIINDQIVPLQTEVNKKVREIRGLLVNIVDETMKTDASNALTRGLELLRKLEVKKQMLENSIFQANASITENKNRINRNNQKIESNNTRVATLEAALRNTEQQNSTLKEFINNVTDFIGNSESLLNDVKLPVETGTGDE